MEYSSNMNKKSYLIPFLIFSIFTVSLFAQVEEEEVQERKKTKKISPNVIRFDKMFEEKEMTREGFQDLQDQREARLKARLASPDALENAAGIGEILAHLECQACPW